MILNRHIISLLDHRGGRRILGLIATHIARRQTGDDVEIFYHNGLWCHRAGLHYFPDGPMYEYLSSNYTSWKYQAKLYVSDAEDFWFRHYNPKNGDVVIDVGAGHGEDTFAFSRAVGDMGRVIAIEAHPLSFRILKEFCQLNQLHNTTLRQTAVMDELCAVSMAESDMWYSNSVEKINGAQGIKVRSTTLDELFKAEDINDVSFLKMNIEGAEQFALSGMESIINRIQTICVACHDFRADRGDGDQFRTRGMVEKVLESNGFKVASCPYDPREYVRDHIFGLR